MRKTTSCIDWIQHDKPWINAYNPTTTVSVHIHVGKMMKEEGVKENKPQAPNEFNRVHSTEG